MRRHRLFIVGCAMLAFAACSDRDGGRSTPAIAITSGATDRASVALTFDAVGDAEETATILSLLSARGVRATFAVTGLWAETHPTLLNAIASDGHQIINLTYNNASLTSQEPAQRALELSRTETTVFRMSSRSTRPFFRPPHGDFDDSVLQDAGEAGYAYAVLWTIDARDDESGSPDAEAQRVISKAQPGAIIALTLTESAAKALPGILDGIESKGFAFETVADIVE